MYKDKISDESFISMAAQAAGCMDPELCEKGRKFSRRVTWTKSYGQRIYSAVNDGKIHNVIIHIDDFAKSTCTCGKKPLCEHIAAVFFHYYDPWLQLKGTQPKKDFKPDKTPKKDLNLLLENQAFVPGMEGPVEAWHEFFGREYNLIRERNKISFHSFPEYLIDEFFLTGLFGMFTERVTAHTNKWPPFNKALYRFHGNLFFLARHEKQTEGRRPSDIDDFFIEKIENDFFQSFTAVNDSKEQEKYRLFFRKAVEVVRERLFFGKTPLFNWLLIYRIMCVHYFDNPEQWKKETAYLEGLMKEPGKSRQYYYAALGLASLKMAARREEDALSVLQKLKEKPIEDMLFYLEYLSEAKEWDKLLAWLRWLAPDIPAADPVILEDICECCFQAAKNSSAREEFINLVKSWLPHSFEPYADYLLGEDLFREWAGLIMSCRGCDWGNIDKSILRHLESRDSEAIIPLYHQWAARLIEEKNRKSYREAIKYLKKLRGIYSRQKMAREWHIFISRLSSCHQRLRALQEELRKGKLIKS